MPRPVYNEHSAAQISQKSRWMALGMVASALAACNWMLSSRNKFRVTDPSVIAYLKNARASLQSAYWILRQTPTKKAKS